MSNARDIFKGEEEGEEGEAFVATTMKAVQALPINLRSAQLMQGAGRAAQARRKRSAPSSSATNDTATTAQQQQQSQQASSTAPEKSGGKY